MASILILNGPNLNLLGTRQPEVYGTTTLNDVEDICVRQAASVGATVTFFQSNHEGDLIDQIHAAKGRFDGIIINAGALSHTSIGIMDALLGVEVPAIDLHLSNIHRREEFRHNSYVAKAAVGAIVGFGPGSYLLAIDAMMMHLDNLAPSDDRPVVEPLEVTKEHRVDLQDSGKDDDLGMVDMSPGADKPKEKEREDPQGQNSFAAVAAAAIAAQTRTGKVDKPDTDKEEEPQAPNSNPAFNEMFDTPPKEVLDSLGIAAPELRKIPDAKPEEKAKKASSKLEDKSSASKQAQVRSFRKLS
jgi:3-dehydroquinate dehydratase-2